LTIAPRTGKYTVRLSSSQAGQEEASLKQSRRSQDNLRSQANLRAQLIGLLRKADYRVMNCKGTQVIELQTMQQKSISGSDAFVFLPSPTLAEVFKLTSLIVGYQTNDPKLRGKPAAVLQLDTTWSPVLEIFRHLEAQGMISAPNRLFTVLDSVEQVAPTIKALAGQGLLEGFDQPSAQGSSPGSFREAAAGQQLPNQVSRQRRSAVPAFNVGVFCSANTQQDSFKRSAYNLGQNLGQKGIGVVFGAGSSGMMGELTRGALDHGGYLRGANISRIARIEGLPHGLQEYWGEESGIYDIYQRLSVMVNHSDAFILLPGGAGTLQELLALLLLLRDKDNPLMRHRVHRDRPKKIVLVNQRLDGSGSGFYDPIIDLIQLFGYAVDEDFHVVADEIEAINQLQDSRDTVGRAVGGRQRPSSTGWANV
jgi:uncharacterized protein (TIGR00730 family)